MKVHQIAAYRHRTLFNLVLYRANGQAQKRHCPAIVKQENYSTQLKPMMRKQIGRQLARGNRQVVRI